MASIPSVKLFPMPAEESFADHFTYTDRVLLIKLDVKMERMATDIDKLQLSGNSQYSGLRTELTANASALEVRVRILENFRWWLLGASVFVSPAISAWVVWLITKHP